MAEQKLKPEQIEFTPQQIKEISRQIKRKRKGSASASIEDHLDVNSPEVKNDIKGIMTNLLYWYNRPKIQNVEECADRLNEFFSRISHTGELATVEKLALALGGTRFQLFDWEHGKMGAEVANMIKKAKEMIAMMDAEMAAKGKIQPVVYIFRAKNYYGMKDQQEVVVTPNVQEEVPEAELIKDAEQIVDLIEEKK